MPVAILAGGLGTRLGDHAGGVPKPVVDVAGEPFLVHVLRMLAAVGVRDVLVSTGFGGDVVRSSVGDGGGLGLAVDYVDDGPVALGTGGAARRCAEVLGGPFMVLNGDSYLPCDYAAVQDAFERSGSPALMVVHRNRGRWVPSNVRVEQGRIVRYDKWEPDGRMEHVDYGLGVLTPGALADVAPGEAVDLGRIHQRLIARGDLAVHEVAERFYEVGSPEGLAEFRELVAARGTGVR